jgi:hypothetical protein
MVEYNGELIQQINPVFAEVKPKNALDYRTQFFASKKYLLGKEMDTYLFNLIVIWFTTFLFYITLYFELLRKLVNSGIAVNLPKMSKLPRLGFSKKK